MKSVKNRKDLWNANLYDNKHAFVSTFGNNLVDLLAPKKGEKILDLGCGTGDLAKRLFDFGVDVEGIDKSKNMVNQARNKYPNIHFVVGDATELKYVNEFDAVFSNATLHWVKPPGKALHCIFESLKQGGRFVAEFGGKGNIQFITDEISNQLKLFGFENNIKKFPWYFPSIGEYSTLMEEAGFRVTFAQHFDRPTPLDGEHGLRNWIEMFAGNMFEGIAESQRNEVLKNMEGHLRAILYQDGNWVADYKRIRVIGIKE